MLYSIFEQYRHVVVHFEVVVILHTAIAIISTVAFVIEGYVISYWIVS